MNKYTFLIPAMIAAMWIVLAADPQQPKVGGKELIVATNGYSGVLTVRTQINLGLSGVEATLATDTNGTIQATSVAASDSPLLQVKGIGNTNQAILGPAGTLYLGNGINVFNGGVIYDGDNIVSYHSPVYDGHSDWAMIVGATELQTEIGGAYSDVYFNGNENETSGYAEMIMETSSANDVDRNRWTIHAEVGTNQKFQFTGGDSTGNGGTLVSFTPLVADGTTPYQMLVSSNHTIGNLAEWGRLGDTPKIQLKWDGAVQTSVPTGATNAQPFKIGDIAAGTVAITTTGYVQVEINGQLVKLGIVK